MKTAVDKVGRGKARVVNARFRAMTSHFLFEAEFCTPAAGWEKGQVEKQVRDARARIWQALPRFPHLAALNAWLEQRCLALWQQLRHPEQPGRTVAEVWADERAHLMRMPPPFDGFVEDTKRVSPTCLVSFEQPGGRLVTQVVEAEVFDAGSSSRPHLGGLPRLGGDAAEDVTVQGTGEGVQHGDGGR